MNKLICITLLLFSVIQLSAQKPDWFNKLKQLRKTPSTETDVERLFNSPKVTYATSIEAIRNNKSKTKLIDYELPEGVLTIFYSAGKCSEENTEGWDFENGVILDYYFKLKDLVPLSKVKIKPDAFPRVFKANDTQHWFYSDPDKGVTYTSLGGKLQYIEYTMPKLNNYKCETVLKQTRK